MPPLLDAIRGEIFVECGATYFPLINDIADERVVFGVLKHGFGVFNALLVHGFWPATTPSTFCGGFETGAGPWRRMRSLPPHQVVWTA